jgi:hypothetical protein
MKLAGHQHHHSKSRDEISILFGEITLRRYLSLAAEQGERFFLSPKDTFGGSKPAWPGPS